MKIEVLKCKPDVSENFVIQKPADCCSPGIDTVKSRDAVLSEFGKHSWFGGVIDTPAGPVPLVSTRVRLKEKITQFRSRVTSFRMSFAVNPGLYAAGNPGSASEVFVTANFGLSFDHLRAALSGIDAWILVLDTGGINVWCAAGKGSFGTDELAGKIISSGIDKCVEHRRIILPQLGAPGIKAGDVRRKTGFRVYFGPVKTEDLKKYLEMGLTADQDMRKVKFGITDRALLIPMELNMAKKGLFYFALGAMTYSALTPEGLIFRELFTTGYPLIAAGLLSIFAGAVFTPLFLPIIPFRSFVLKGAFAGIVVLLAVHNLTDLLSSNGQYFQAAAYILIPLLGSYIGFQFTGASTYTSLSGVQKELKYSLPFYIIGIIVSIVLLVLSKASEWGYL